MIHSHSQQIFSADLLSRFSQQIFSADFLSRSSQQIFSADFLSRSSQQIFSADLLSRSSSQQIFSADLLSRSSQQIFSADFHSRSSQLSCCCGQGLVVSYCLITCCGQLVGGQLLSHHLLWLGVGGQLLSDQLLSYHLLWSGVGGQLLSYHVGGQYCTSSLEGPFRGAFGKKNIMTLTKWMCLSLNPRLWRRPMVTQVPRAIAVLYLGLSWANDDYQVWQSSETSRCWWIKSTACCSRRKCDNSAVFGLGTRRPGCKISCQRLARFANFYLGPIYQCNFEKERGMNKRFNFVEIVCNLWCWKPFSSMKTQRSRQYTISESTGSFSSAFVPFHAVFFCACLLTGKEPPQLACHPMKTLRHIFQSWQIQTMLTRFGYSLIQSVSL